MALFPAPRFLALASSRLDRPSLAQPVAKIGPASLSLSLLLNAAGAALDRLWLLRAERDIGVLLPDYLDPGHGCPLSGPPSALEASLQDELLQIGGQMRCVGLRSVARAILDLPLTPRRQAALLALAGSASWQAVAGQPALRRRRAADGQIYLLASEAGVGARHAPHAMLALRQRLWILPEGIERADLATAKQREDAADCLSLDLALRDVAFGLEGEGETTLARQVLALCGADAVLACAVPPVAGITAPAAA
jgi:hypothetical protein